jgi:RimJ/RimL family protein N-acetyltransferase
MIDTRVRSIVAETDAANHRAQRVLRAVGFAPLAREGDGPPGNRDTVDPLLFCLRERVPHPDDTAAGRHDPDDSIP